MYYATACYNLRQIGRTRLPFNHLTADTLAYYEREGWLHQERENGRRTGYCDLTDKGRAMVEG